MSPTVIINPGTIAVDPLGAAPSTGAMTTAAIIPPKNKAKDMRLWSLNFLLVSCVVVSVAPAAFAPFASDIGDPQLGQVGALLDTSLSQSGHFISAIACYSFYSFVYTQYSRLPDFGTCYFIQCGDP